jgi:hypothetical protein
MTHRLTKAQLNARKKRRARSKKRRAKFKLKLKEIINGKLSNLREGYGHTLSTGWRFLFTRVCVRRRTPDKYISWTAGRLSESRGATGPLWRRASPRRYPVATDSMDSGISFGPIRRLLSCGVLPWLGKRYYSSVVAIVARRCWQQKKEEN